MNTESGMPVNGVSNVIQDSRGYIWASTFNGLVRYDGKRKFIYNTGNLPDLQTNRFTRVIEAPDGVIWAGLEYSSLVKIDQNQSEVYQIDPELAEPNTYVTEIFFEDDDTIWIGTNMGVFIFENGSFEKVEDMPGQVVQEIFRHNGEIYLLFEFCMVKLHEDKSVEKILEITGSDIAYKDSYVVEGFNNVERFWDILWHDGGMILVHENGIIEMRENDYEILLRKEDISQSTIHGLRYRNGKYYVFGADGLYVIDEFKRGESRAVSYSTIRITDMMFDHEGSVWISTSANGLIQFVETPVYQGNRFEVIADEPVTAIMEDRHGTLWIGTNCDGLYTINGDDVDRYGNQQGIENVCVWSVMEQSDGTIWAGTWGGGVYYLPPGEQQFTRFEPPVMQEANAVLSVFEDSDGNIWFGSYDKGLFRFDGTETVSIKNESGGNLSAVRMMVEDETGTIMFATDRGIGYLNNDQIVKPAEFNQLQIKNFRIIKKDSEGRFWFGSYGGGIFVYVPGGNHKVITTGNGLFDNTVSQIQFDEDENVWLAGNLGVFFIEKSQIEKFLVGEINRLRVSRIGVSEGLPIRETTGGFMPSSHYNDDGELFIPTVRGLAMLQTGRMQLNTTLANLYLQEIEINGEVFKPEEISKIPYDSHRIIFRFTALSFKNPDYVQFQYILEGIDTHWHNANESREAIYTTLSAGEYQLMVRASNNDGFWTENQTMFTFSVTPPFWKTNWFVLLMFISIGGIIFGIYRFRVNNIRKMNILLQRKVDERTRELRASNSELKELIDEKNKLHRVLAHDLRNPFTAILGYLDLLKSEFEDTGDAENAEVMKMLLDSGRSTLNLLENLLHWSGSKIDGMKEDIKSINIQKLIEDVIAATEAQANFKKVEVISNVSAPIMVQADRNMISTVLRNLVSNAIKFSGTNQTVEVNAVEKKDKIVVSVSDQGIGIQKEELNNIFSSNGAQHKLGTAGEKGIGLGLKICKEFIDIHKGRIWVESETGTGSRFYFTLKKAPLLADVQNR